MNTSPPIASLSPVDGLTDEELAKLIARGDSPALSTAYRLYGPKVLAVAKGIVRDADLAADITQDVFERLWNRTNRFDPHRGSLATFLTVDARGRSIDLLRSRNASLKRERDDFARRSGDMTPDTEAEALRRIEASRVRSSLADLPEEQRIPIALAFFEGIPYRQVAERLSTPEGTVKSRIRAGLQTLGSSLETLASVA